MRDPAAALDLLDLAVARAADLVGEEAVSPYAGTARDARRRTGFLGATVVVALAGGTGSGKSSLLNALAGEEVAPTGAVRPTTDRPLAWVPAQPEPGIVRLLDDLGVDDRIGQERYPELVVLDLPDVDSVVADHRTRVEALLPRVDAVIWVVDPEKYHDRVLHADYLARLAGYQSQFLFVLNQIDRIPAGEVERVVADLVEALQEDGISDPTVFALAADPPDGPPRDVQRLAQHLEEWADVKRLAVEKLAADLRATATGLAEVTGVTSAGLDFDRRWEPVRMATAGRLADGVAGPGLATAAERAGRNLARRKAGGPLARVLAALRRSRLGRALGARQDDEEMARVARRWTPGGWFDGAVSGLDQLITDLSFEAGGAFGTRMRAEFGATEVEGEIRGSIDAAVAAGGPAPHPSPARWWSLIAALQVVVLLTVAGSAVWAWARPSSLSQGRWPLPLLVGLAAVAVGVGAARLARVTGARRGRRAAAAYRAELAEAIGRHLDRRIGVPLRTLVRSRAELAGALTELGLAAAQLQRSG